MKLRTKLWMSACVAALLGVSPLLAQEKLPPPGGVKPAAPPMPVHGAAPAPTYHYQPSCCQPDCCDSGCGFVAGAEIVWLRAHISERDLSGHDYEIGYRVWAGIESDGLGFRVRWFDYDESSPPNGAFDSHDLTVVDFEVTSGFDLHGVSLTGSAGLRYAEFEQRVGTSINGIEESYGIVLGLELRREVCCSTNAYLAFRHALMYGDDQDTDEFQTFTITEIQLGAEYVCDTGSCAVFVRGGVEAQFWAGVSGDDSENFGLLGGFLAVGVRK